MRAVERSALGRIRDPPFILPPASCSIPARLHEGGLVERAHVRAPPLGCGLSSCSRRDRSVRG